MAKWPCCAVDLGCTAADAAQRVAPVIAGTGAGGMAALGRVVESAAGAGCRGRADRRCQLRQRLLRRNPGHRRQPGRPGAAGGRAAGDPAIGAGRGGDQPGGGRGGGLGAGAAQRTVADRGRRRLHRRRLAVHRRVQTLRLCGFRRSRRIRVLRPGRRARHQYTQALRVDWVGLVLAVSIGALSSAVLVATTCGTSDRHRVGQDHPAGAAGRCPHPGALPSAAGQRRGDDPGV